MVPTFGPQEKQGNSVDDLKWECELLEMLMLKMSTYEVQLNVLDATHSSNCSTYKPSTR